ncbi:YbaN family protein [Inhella gelatinilytica]|uniref:YbaN family protein n=1 Tax=Inhella gelatinilytica TaxID=2795030 RepID=A0A931IXS4_9BURK|nr:YbaN family protein [Inhella gelatinilytica]MBH9552583.1 YbaN family protein [Inhella gelatinilytica]
MRDSLPDTSSDWTWARPLWLLAGWACTLLGIAGVILPLLPGVPFLLLAAFCFSKGSPRWEAWLVAHPQLGPYVLDWRRYGVIPRRAKTTAWAMMSLGVALAAWRAPWWAALCAGITCLSVALWMRAQPEAPPPLTRPSDQR